MANKYSARVVKAAKALISWRDTGYIQPAPATNIYSIVDSLSFFASFVNYSFKRFVALIPIITTCAKPAPELPPLDPHVTNDQPTTFGHAAKFFLARWTAPHFQLIYFHYALSHIDRLYPKGHVKHRHPPIRSQCTLPNSIHGCQFDHSRYERSAVNRAK